MNRLAPLGLISILALALAAPATAQVVAAAPGVDVAEIARETTRALRPHLRIEYESAVATCGLSPEQRRRVARDGEAMLKQVARECAEAQAKPAVGHRVPPMPDGRVSIRRAFPEILRAVATPEQFARYAEEERLREDDRRREAVAIMVDKLDQALTLAPAQREALARSFLAGWSDEWASGPDAYVDDNVALLPKVPDPLILPTLGPSQAAAWKAHPKHKFVTSPHRFTPTPDALSLDGEEPR